MIASVVRDKAEYMFALVEAFAKMHKMSLREAYDYIQNYDGMQLVDECYGIMHTLSFADAYDSLLSYLRRQGGGL